MRKKGGEPLVWRDAGEFMKHVASGKAEADCVFRGLLPTCSFGDESITCVYVSTGTCPLLIFGIEALFCSMIRQSIIN